jgi:iron complex outermembrane recepter protein
VTSFKMNLLGASVLMGVAAFAAPTLAAENATTTDTAAVAAEQQPAPAPAAQPAPPPPPAARATPPEQTSTVVVTGSRLQRSTFTSASPLTVVTNEQAEARGQTDAASVLQTTTAAAGSSQINNFFTGFVVEGGPGVNTLSLRGLGPGRTLVLFDGRRLPPSGVRGQVNAIDLNTIPTLAVARYDILRDGFSPIYGSDAIGGVVNVITRKNVDGFELTGTANGTFEGGGEQYRVGALYGRTFDRWNFMISGEITEQRELNLEDREYTNCVDDYVFDSTTGLPADVIDPATGKPKCFNGGFASAIRPGGDAGFGSDWIASSTATAVTIGARPDAVLLPAGTPMPWGANAGRTFPFAVCFLSSGGIASTTSAAVNTRICTATPLTVPGFRKVFNPGFTFGPNGLPNGIQSGVPGSSLFPSDNQFYDERDIISQSRRSTIYGQLNYDIPVFGGVNLGLSGFWNRRESSQDSGAQLFFTLPATNVYSPFGAAGLGAVTPVLPRPANNAQEVTTWQGVFTLSGNTGNGIAGIFANGTWDFSIQQGKGDGDYSFTSILGDRLNATLATTITNGVASCPTPTLSGGTCVPVNFFDPRVVAGNYNAAELDYLFGAPNLGNTVYEQTVYEGSFGGDLFQIPGAADPVAASFGFHLREYSINDVPGAETLRGNVLLTTAAGITRGTDNVQEFFGEVTVPLLAKLPLIENLVVSGAYRFTEYDSYPANETYKLAANWTVTPELRIRAGIGTSYKAPALFELFLGDQTSFLGQLSIDPCVNWGNSTNQTIRTRCQAAGVPEFYNAGGTQSATIVTGGGLGVLREETAETTSFGFVYEPELPAGNQFRMSADYSRVENNDQVAQFGAGAIAGACYGDPDAGRAAVFCTLLQRNANNAAARPNEIITIQNDYVNINVQQQEEIILNLDYQRDLGFGTLNINSESTWQISNEFGLFNANALSLLAGDIGFPQFTNLTELAFRRQDWRFVWTMNFIGQASNGREYTESAIPNPQPVALGTFYSWTGTREYTRKVETEPTIYHGFSVRYRSDDWTVIGGMSNIFGEDPPAISSGVDTRLGRSALTSQYDQRGRSAFVTVTRRF